jgi:hypothetical protein
MKLIKTANPNRLGRILLEKDENGMFWLTLPDCEGYDSDPYDVGTDEVAALESFGTAVSEQANTPNWEMQAEYDEAHGTIGGYAPWQFCREF